MECPHCGAPLAASYMRGDRRGVCPVCGGGLAAAAAPTPQQVPAVAGAATEATEAQEPPPAPTWAAGPTEAELSGMAFVCLTEERKVNPLEVGPLVEQFTGLARADARQHAARSMGLIAEGLSLDAAQSLVAALGGKGIRAFALPAARVPRQTQEVDVTRVHSAEDDGLHLEMDVHGTRKKVPWQQVVAGLCTQKQFPDRQTASVQVDRPVPVAGAGFGTVWVRDTETIQVDRPARPTLRVTLVLAGRPDVACVVAFGEGEVRYAYLGERVRPMQRQNLSLLLGDIAAHCPHGFFPAGYHAAATGADARVPKVVGTADYGHYVQWAVCCAAARNLFQTDGQRPSE